MASQLGIGNTLRPPASYALAVLQESSCGSSPSAGHVIHSLPRLGATEQNSGCCCKISGRKLFSHSFQWFSFRPVSAVISQKTLIYFVQSPTPFLCLLPCRDIIFLRPAAGHLSIFKPGHCHKIRRSGHTMEHQRTIVGTEDRLDSMHQRMCLSI